MTQEEKDLLLKDLSSRYPYGVVLHFDVKVEQDDEPLYNIRKNGGTYLINDAYYLEEVKPYLRPMESMTEEEKRELQSFYPGCFGNQWLDIKNGSIDIFECGSTISLYLDDSKRIVDWLNKKMFDYRGLIENGLAIEVTEENNPYK